MKPKSRLWGKMLCANENRLASLRPQIGSPNPAVYRPMEPATSKSPKPLTFWDPWAMWTGVPSSFGGPGPAPEARASPAAASTARSDQRGGGFCFSILHSVFGGFTKPASHKLTRQRVSLPRRWSSQLERPGTRDHRVTSPASLFYHQSHPLSGGLR